MPSSVIVTRKNAKIIENPSKATVMDRVATGIDETNDARLMTAIFANASNEGVCLMTFSMLKSLRFEIVPEYNE